MLSFTHGGGLTGFCSLKESFLVSLWSSYLIFLRSPVEEEELVLLVAKWMAGEPLWTGPLPLWLPFLWTQEPLCHSAPASNAWVVSESQRDPAPCAEFLTSSVSALLHMATALAALSGAVSIVVMGNRSSHCLCDHSRGCFTDTLMHVLQTELVILTCLLHLKPCPLLGFPISTHLLKPDTQETSLIPSLFPNFHDTKPDDVYLQNLVPISSLFTLSFLFN